MPNSTTVLVWSAVANVAAILAAPAVALWIQRRVDQGKASNTRRQAIFTALWVNRRRPFYLARVDALNMIDLEFFKEKKIREAWADLFAHYNHPPPGLGDPQLIQQRDEKYSLLLFEISETLGYGFGKAYIRDNIYRPELHNTVENTELETRALVLNLLKSDALPVRFVPPEQVAAQAVRGPIPTEETLAQLASGPMSPTGAPRLEP